MRISDWSSDVCSSDLHDVGMVWGARLLSPTGLFTDENATAPNERPISRHIVFMTDGEMAPNVPNLTSQGYEYLMQRVSGSFDTSNGELEDRLNNRFRQFCPAPLPRETPPWVGIRRAAWRERGGHH